MCKKVLNAKSISLLSLARVQPLFFYASLKNIFINMSEIMERDSMVGFVERYIFCIFNDCELW